jgi:succinyl-diaminopimelate desuccinylase
MDAVELAQALIRRPSVTPRDEGALDVLEAAALGLGFTGWRLPFGEGAERVDNLVAHRPGRGPRLAFAGHTDVVPAGDPGLWSSGAFDATIRDGMLTGRGAADMKGAIAAWMAAVAHHLAAGHDPDLLLIVTGDEEGEALNGTVRLAPWIAAKGLTPTATLVGEPTSRAVVGDTLKIGRRGSVNFWVEVEGRQGHVAYPERNANPLHALARIAVALRAGPLDEGTEWFPPSNLEVTRLEGGDPTASNLVPAAARARINIRFNDRHGSAGLLDWAAATARAHAGDCAATIRVMSASEAFLTPPGPFVALVADAVKSATGARPALSTTGGTSDARFLRALGPVVELGLPGATMHQADERVAVADIVALTGIYRAVLEAWRERAATLAPAAAAA